MMGREVPLLALLVLTGRTGGGLVVGVDDQAYM